MYADTYVKLQLKVRFKEEASLPSSSPPKEKLPKEEDMFPRWAYTKAEWAEYIIKKVKESRSS